MVYSLRAVGRSVVNLPGPWSLHRRHRPTEVDKDVRSSRTSKVFTIFTQTVMRLVYPPKLCITIVFDFSWDDCNTLESLETMVMQNSEGENKVHCGPYESSDYKRCKVCLKLSYLMDNPGVVRGYVNQDYATGQRVVCEQALCLGKKIPRSTKGLFTG